MTESNRVRMTWVDEITPGVTPASPRMRGARFTGETLAFTPTFTDSAEIRDDRMSSDAIKTNETNSGPVNTEWSYPVDLTPHSSWLASLFANAWSNTPTRDNDGTAGSAITGITASSGAIAVVTGPAFAVGHLVRLSGFSVAANAGLFRIMTGSATAPAVGASKLADESAPPATARMKVVGFEGTSGDIKAVADGLTSTALNFTTLGLTVGQWIKVGGSGDAFRFATAACNGFARITAIAAGKLTLDHLPTAWAADAGSTKTIRVFFGDTLKNGVQKRFGTIERGFLGQTSPTYIKQAGMLVGQGQISLEAGAIVTANYTFTGMAGESGPTSLDALPDPVTDNPVMSAAVNVGRISVGGGAVIGPNFIKGMTISINNNVRTVDAIRGDGKFGASDINLGECAVEVSLNTYFGSGAAYAEYIAGVPTSASAVVHKDGQATIFTVPRLVRTDGNPNAGGKNQDVMLQFTAKASKDPLTQAHVTLDRMEYYEG